MNQAQPTSLFSRVISHSDILVAFGVIGVLMIMVVPLPTALLDILLVINITLALTVLLVSMYLNEPLEFSVFPGMLLVLTLFRLSINVASTRLILGDGYAGNVISAFGGFVVKGNYVVGFIIFLILVIIQFVVITKGAGRIAEVAARFTLDAMPGKQMAIDADLNAGLVDEMEARKRREKISREADFYGAMDGASKFVRGDAIAGLIVTVVNILGGFVIGVAQMGLSFSEALQTYTLLTVGDGLVSQIPALILSTSAGIVVTRASSESNLGQDLTAQLLSQPRALYIVSGALLVFGLMPGLPALPFFILAGVSGFLARGTTEAQKVNLLREQAEAQEIESPEEESFNRYLQVDPLEIEIGYGLIPLVDEEQGGDLLGRITAIRKQCALELGIIIPPIRIRDNIGLNPEEYVIKIRGVEAARGEVHLNRVMALPTGDMEIEVEGIKTNDPAFGLPAVWIPVSQKAEAEKNGYTIVELGAVIATHLKEILKRNAEKILSREDVGNLVENVKKENSTVVDELIPNLLTIGQLQKVLQNLLRERVPIRDMVTILEALADYSSLTKEPDILTEEVRSGLAKTIYRSYLSDDGIVYSLTLDPSLDRLLSDNLAQNKNVGLNLPPQVLKNLYGEVESQSENMSHRGLTPLILCSPVIRPFLKRLLEMAFPQLAVLSYNEIPTDVDIQSAGIIRLENED